MFSRAVRLIVVLGLVAASSVFTAGPASPAGADLVIKSTGQTARWKPKHSFVRMGKDGKAIVKWKNPTNTVHDIKSTNEGKDWFLRRTTLRKGDSKSKTFKARGNYYFRCTIHSVRQSGGYMGMVGIVHVRK